MLSNIPRELVFLLLFIALVAVFWRFTEDKKHVRKLRQEATRDFLSLAIASQDEKYSFSGSTAVIERREEAGGGRGIFETTADFSVTIYARNDYGEKFLFKWHSKSKQAPCVTHLSK